MEDKSDKSDKVDKEYHQKIQEYLDIKYTRKNEIKKVKKEILKILEPFLLPIVIKINAFLIYLKIIIKKRRNLKRF